MATPPVSGQGLPGAKKKRVATDADLRHRFLTFSEQLKTIDIKVTQRNDRFADAETTTCYYAEGLEKWRDTNRSQDFTDYRIKVRNLSGNVALLVLHQDQIIDLTTHYLAKPGTLAVEPLLELVVHLARDLGEDFFRHFDRIFACLALVVSPADKAPVAASTIGLAFRAVAYCFKFLRKQLLADLDPFFSKFRAVLGKGHPAHVRKFAAESYAYLLRKIPLAKLEGHVGVILDTLSPEGVPDEYVDSIGILLSETVKHVAHQFHSRTPAFLSLCLARLNGNPAALQNLSESLERAFIRMVEFTKQKHADMVWECTLDHLDTALAALIAATATGVTATKTQKKSKHKAAAASSADAEALIEPIAKVFAILAGAAEHWDGSRITDLLAQRGAGAIAAFVGQTKTPVTDAAFEPALDLAKALLLHAPDRVDGARLIGLVISRSEDHLDAILDFGKDLIAEISARDGLGHQLIRMATEALPAPAGIGKKLAGATTAGLDDPRTARAMTFLVGVVEDEEVVRTMPHSDREALQAKLLALLTGCAALPTTPVSTVWACATVLKEVGIQSKEAAAVLRGAFEGLSARSGAATKGTAQWDCLIYAAAGCILGMVACTPASALPAMVPLVLEQLATHHDSIHVLRACDFYFEILRSFGKKSDAHFTKAALVELIPTLQRNLGSLTSEVRIVTLQLLERYEQVHYVAPTGDGADKNADGYTEGACDIFRRCLLIERTPADLASWRERKVGLEVFLTYRMRRQLPDVYREPVTRFLLASLGVNFAPLIESASEILVRMLGSYTEDVWSIVRDEFARSTDALLLDGAGPATVDAGDADEDPEDAGDMGGVLQRHLAENSPNHRCDELRLHGSVCKVMTEVAALTERHNREVIPVFLRFMEDGYDVCFQGSAKVQDLRSAVGAVTGGDDDDDDNAAAAAAEAGLPSTGPIFSKKVVTAILCNFLGVFAKFTNPSQVHSGDRLESIFRDLLLRADGSKNTAQALALSCLKQYKFKYMNPYYDHLTKLIDEGSELRENLLKFSLDESNAVVKPEHRKELLDVVHRILLSKMMARKSKGKGNRNPKTRRRQILRFFNGCDPSEMENFTSLLFEPYSDSLDLAVLADVGAVVPLQKQLGYLNNLTDLIAILGTTIETILPRVIAIILRMVYNADHVLSDRDTIAPGHISVLKSIRVAGIRRLGDLLVSFPSVDFRGLMPSIDAMVVARPLQGLHSESAQTASPILEYFLKCSGDKRLHYCLQGLDDTILPKVIELLSVSGVTDTVAEVILTISDNLLGGGKDVSEKQKHRRSAKAATGKGRFFKPNQRDASDDEMETEDVAAGSDAEATDAESPTEVHVAPSVLVPHIPTLLNHLPSAMLAKLTDREGGKGSVTLFGSGQPSPSVRAGLATVGKKPQRGSTSQQSFTTLQLSILSQITPYATDAATSSSVVNMLLPFLAMRPPDVLERHKTLILRTAVDTTNLFGLSTSHFGFLAKLFETLWSPTTRLLLSQLFVAMGAKDPKLGEVGDLLVRLHAMDTSSIEDEFDYTARVAAFRDINDGMADFSVQQLLPIVHVLVHYCNGEDVALRNNAAHSLELVIGRVAVSTDLSSKTAGSAEHKLILDVLYPAIKGGLRGHNKASRDQFVGFLEQLVVAFPKCPVFACFLPLRSVENEEQDFFKNIKHIQVHRRMRAVRMVQLSAEAGDLPEEALLGVLHPLVAHFLFESSQANEHNLIYAAIDFIGALSQHIIWTSYSWILRKYMKLLRLRPKDEKIMVRTVVSILNNFSFAVDEDDPEVSSAVLAASDADASAAAIADAAAAAAPTLPEPRPLNGDAEEEEGDGDAAEDKAEEEEEEEEPPVDLKTSGADILQALTRQILPAMTKLLVVRNKEENTISLRSAVALAITQLLVKLPKAILDSKLPQLVVKVTGVLRDRMESTRDAARQALGQMAVVLGASYVPMMTKEMRVGLSRGYQLHVLAYTVHHILVAVAPDCPTGSLDDGIDDFIAIFIDDIFGAAADEKEIDGIVRKLKEAKKASSFDSFARLARVLSPGRLADLIEPLKDAMGANDDSKTAGKLEEIFRNVTIGVKANAAFSVLEIAQVSTDLVRENLALSQQGSTSSKAKKQLVSIYILAPEVLKPKTAETCFNTNAHLLVVMGLTLLSTQLKRSAVAETDEATLAALDGMVPLVVDCLHSKFNKVIGLGLRVAASLLPLAELLPAVKPAGDKIANRVFKLMRRSGSSSSAIELNQACFRVATVLVRDCRWHNITEAQARVIVSFVEMDLEATEKQQNAFSVLRAIISRQIVIAEVYDVVDKVLALMVRAHSSSARKLCRHVVLPFLLDFPLGQKRLEKTVMFLVSNLDFELDSGKESVFLLLESVIIKFPDTVINDFAELFFVSIAKQQINVDSPTLHKLAAQTLSALLLRIPPALQDSLSGMVLAWIRDPNPDVCRTGIATSQAFVEALGKGYARHAASVLKLVGDVVVGVTRAVQEDEAEADDGEPQLDSWELLYSASVCLEKIFATFPKLLLTSIDGGADVGDRPAQKRKIAAADATASDKEGGEADADERLRAAYPLWDAVGANLLHGHSWVRLASSRLFGCYFSKCTPGSQLVGYVAQENVMFRLAKSFCRQLESGRVSEPLADQLVKNLFFIGRHLYAVFATLPEGQLQVEKPGEAVAGTGEEEVNGEDSDGDEGAAGDADVVVKTSGLVWVCKQMAYLARLECTKAPGQVIKRDSVFKWFAAMANHGTEPSFASRFLAEMVDPLYRTDESDASSEAVKDLAAQVQDMLKKLVGASDFFAGYEAARSKIAKARLSRRRDRKSEVIKNPVRAAERKIKKNLKKREHRKRKIIKHREDEGRPTKRR